MSVSAMSWAFQQDTYPTHKFILVALANFADDKMQCFPRVKTLMEMTSLGESTIRRNLTELEEQGLIRKIPQFREDGSQRATLYQLDPTPLSDVDPLNHQDTNRQKEPTDTNVSAEHGGIIDAEVSEGIDRKVRVQQGDLVIPKNQADVFRQFIKGRQEGSRKLNVKTNSEYDSWPDESPPEKKPQRLNARNLAVDFHDQAKVDFGGLTITNVGALASNISKWHKAGIKYEEIEACIRHFFAVPKRYMWNNVRPWQAFVYKFQQIRKDCDWTDPTEKRTYHSFERPRGSRVLVDE